MEWKQMVRDIARELLQQMQLPPKPQEPKVLFIFCDSTAHEAYQDQFIELKNAGVSQDLLFLDGETAAWLNMRRIESSGSSRVIAADEYAPAPVELPREYDGIIVPEIDLDNAARVVSGMKGTVKAEIIFAALVLGKFVIVGAESTGLKRSDRRTLKVTRLPEPYCRLFRQQMDQMRALGVEVAPQAQLAARVLKRLGYSSPDAAPVPEGGASAANDAPEGKPVISRAKLITAEWVRAQAGFPGGRLLVRKDAIISPLARDLLKSKGVAVSFTE